MILMLSGRTPPEAPSPRYGPGAMRRQDEATPPRLPQRRLPVVLQRGARYVAETGDLAFYDLVCVRRQGRATGSHCAAPSSSTSERTGKHGLPCGLLADWNDCLKLGYKGESVFVTFQLRLGLKTYAEIADALAGPASRSGRSPNWPSSTARSHGRAGTGLVHLGHQRDGVVFGTRKPRRARSTSTRSAGHPLGSRHGQAGGPSARAVSALAQSTGGPVQPAVRKDAGEGHARVLFNPGNKENGGIFSHTQSWIGSPNRAGPRRRGLRLLPLVSCRRPERAGHIREIEPYVTARAPMLRSKKLAGPARVAFRHGLPGRTTPPPSTSAHPASWRPAHRPLHPEAWSASPPAACSKANGSRSSDKRRRLQRRQVAVVDGRPVDGPDSQGTAAQRVDIAAVLAEWRTPRRALGERA